MIKCCSGNIDFSYMTPYNLPALAGLVRRGEYLITCKPTG
jgi:hypothetical protein